MGPEAVQGALFHARYLPAIAAPAQAIAAAATVR
jgi:hypothetical protein